MPPCTYRIPRSCLLSITLRTEESGDSPRDSLQKSGDQRFHAANCSKDRYELEGDRPVIPACYLSLEVMVTFVVSVRLTLSLSLSLSGEEPLRCLSLDIFRMHVRRPTVCCQNSAF